MREAFGGTFMISVFFIFLVIYAAFIAIAFNYAKAFRVKNRVIDIIEQNEGMSFTNRDTDSEIAQIEQFMNIASYRVAGINSSVCGSAYQFVDSSRGYCVGKKEETSVDGVIISYYKVRTFVRLQIPFLHWFDFTIPVNGETRRIERIS